MKLPTRHCPSYKTGLETRTAKSGISPLAPSRLASELQSLPPILHITVPVPMPGYSKAPQGLFVLLRVTRVFTGIGISPGPSPRQRSGRYTIHAGRNLPDKGFRYLRTVRVTAAANRGFSSGLRLAASALPLTFRCWAGVGSYTAAYALCRNLCFC